MTHLDCIAEIITRMAGMGVDVTVSTEPPLVVGPYTKPPMVCPHGTTYWFEPTGEQIAEWVAKKVE